MYSSEMTVRDIQAHLQDIYGVEVSAELVSRVTDSIFTEMREWRNRPLALVYPIVYLDALRVNSREGGKHQNKTLHIALEINMEGHKEVLDFYLGENEGPSSGWKSSSPT